MKVGWYPDPDDDNARRYWDGEEWSAPLPRREEVAEPGPSMAKPPAEPGPPAERATKPTKPFDPYAPISEDNPIPDDCVWKTHPYPGNFVPLDKKMARRSVPERFVALGTIKGRPLGEIQAYVGLPQSWTTMGSIRHAAWSQIDIHRGSYHYTLGFDPYDICTGIVQQMNH